MSELDLGILPAQRFPELKKKHPPVVSRDLGNGRAPLRLWALGLSPKVGHPRAWVRPPKHDPRAPNYHSRVGIGQCAFVHCGWPTLGSERRASGFTGGVH